MLWTATRSQLLKKGLSDCTRASVLFSFSLLPTRPLLNLRNSYSIKSLTLSVDSRVRLLRSVMNSYRHPLHPMLVLRVNRYRETFKILSNLLDRNFIIYYIIMNDKKKILKTIVYLWDFSPGNYFVNFISCAINPMKLKSSVWAHGILISWVIRTKYDILLLLFYKFMLSFFIVFI